VFSQASRSSSLVAVVVACLAAGCDGSNGTAPVTGDAATPPTLFEPVTSAPCDAGAALVFQSLANFDNTSQLAGAYSTFVSGDGTAPLYQGGQPVPFEPTECQTGYTVTQDALPQARCGTDLTGLHLRAGDAGTSGLTGSGMEVDIDLRQNCFLMSNTGDGTGPDPCFFDATGWTGLSFWALLGPQSSGHMGLSALFDPNTASQLGGGYPFNTLVCGNPPCVSGVPPATTCNGSTMPPCLCDPFGLEVNLVSSWAFYAIPFERLGQSGLGVREPALDVAHLLGFKFSLGPGVWDLWIDDVGFYKTLP
jgi:hypothetical protein